MKTNSVQRIGLDHESPMNNRLDSQGFPSEEIRLSLPVFQRELRHATGISTALATIRSLIFEPGLSGGRPISVPQLQHRHVVHHLQWAQEHKELPI